jgi:hypothetical protein
VQLITCTASKPLDFDAVIEAITQRYPGTRVVEPDWYAQRHAKEVALCRSMGWPMTHPPLLSLERCWAEFGLQRGFEVPIRQDILLYARLDKTGGYFLRKRGTVKPIQLAPLVEILERFGLVLMFN